MKRSYRFSRRLSGTVVALGAALALIGTPSRAAAQSNDPPPATPAVTNTTTPTPAPDAADPAPQQTSITANVISAPRLEIYGAAMLDMGFQANQNDPNWFDVVRPTKLPAFANQFGEDGHFFSGVRQSRFGVRAYVGTPIGELKTVFEYELFGTGVDAGQTTFRLRHAYGELGTLRSGPDVEPVHGPGRLPQLDRVPGARTAWCSSGTSRRAGCRSWARPR